MSGISNGLKEFIFSTGADIIKETAKEHYNEAEIRRILEEYIERKRTEFEQIDKEFEIDFFNLEKYIRNSLLEDFKESLIGDRTQRERKKKDIRQKLCHYLSADTKKKQEYVDMLLNHMYDIISDYYEREVPAAEKLAQNKATDEVLKALERHEKAISEIAEGQKKMQKNSNDDMNNADGIKPVNNTGTANKDVVDSINKKMEAIHKMVIDKFIKKHYRDDGNLSEKYDEYSICKGYGRGERNIV